MFFGNLKDKKHKKKVTWTKIRVLYLYDKQTTYLILKLISGRLLESFEENLGTVTWILMVLSPI